jgi:hypothetical protein
MARREWTAHSLANLNRGAFLVPELNEAILELKSGRDLYDGEWPEPQMLAVPLEDQIVVAEKQDARR